MSSQYDEIGKRYDGARELACNEVNLPSILAVLPDVRGLKCLDLACGLGRYSKVLVERGADKVIGIDISKAMIAGAWEAAEELPPERKSRLEFKVADCSVPTRLADGPFDLVFAAWLLNYAPDAEAMLGMWRTIHDNLKPGGRLVAQIPHSDLDMATPLDSRYGADVRATEILDEGWKIKISLFSNPPVQFETYHLKRDVYDDAARRAGMADLLYHAHILPDDNRRSTDFWDVYEQRPHFQMLTATRPV